jgi:hypothetical protein
MANSSLARLRRFLSDFQGDALGTCLCIRLKQSAATKDAAPVRNYLVSATPAAGSSASATSEVSPHHGSGFIHSQHSAVEFGTA